MLSNAPPFLHLRRMSMMLSFIIVLGVDHNSPEEDFLMQRQSDEDLNVTRRPESVQLQLITENNTTAAVESSPHPLDHSESSHTHTYTP